MSSDSENKKKLWIYGGAAVALAAAIGVGYWLQSRRSADPIAPKTPSGSAPTAPTNPTAASLTDFTSLEAAGYKFNEAQQLVSISDGSPFKFKNQEHYDAIGDLVIEFVQEQMRSKYGLQQIRIPPSENKWTPQSDIFCSPDWETNPKMLVLLQGSGAVRPGIWGRSLCINKDLNWGTMLPYISRAIDEGYSLVILNPNKNREKKGTEKFLIEGSESPEAHTTYVWDRFINPSQAKDVYFVSHSYGGKCTVQLIKARYEQVAARVKAIAFTDSVHQFGTGLTGDAQRAADLLMERARHWITDTRPLNTEILAAERSVVRGSQCRCFSAGTTDHASTNHASIAPVFEFFSEIANANVKADQ